MLKSKSEYSLVATESPPSLSEDNINLRVADERTTTETMPSKLRRKWQVFPGKNTFCCDGRIMMAKQSGIFYLTCFLIVGTTGLFFGFDCPYLAVTLSPAIPAVGVFTLVIVMANLFRTSFTDPGIIPRATPDEASYTEKQIDVSESSGGLTSYRPPPRTRDVIIRGQVVRLKYCFTCKIFRPPRASHCSVCDNCVERFDHHCPWVGNCVGLRNYRYFYLFLVSLSLHCVFIFACVITNLILRSRFDGFFSAIKETPASVAEGIICFFSIWSILGLTGFHTYLTVSNQTTNEDMKGSYSSKHGQDSFNPYSRESVFADYCLTVCGPLPPSLLDRRGFVLPDDVPSCIGANGHALDAVLPASPSPNGDVFTESNAVNIHSENNYGTTVTQEFSSQDSERGTL